MKRAIVALVFLAAACGSAAPTATSSAVVLTEGHIAVDTSHFAAGEVTLTISNTGEFGHTLVITDDGGAVLAATALIGPGEQTTLAVNLVPGAYQFSCRIVSSSDGQVFDHYQMGMVARVEVSNAVEAAG